MPVNVRDLKPGDRVMLNCPKARYKARREAEFQKIYTPAELREKTRGDRGLLVVGNLDPHSEYAVFLLTVAVGEGYALVDGNSRLHIPNPPGAVLRHSCAMRITDGTLKDDEGRTVFIEQRLGRASFG
jgi:hypothetical protein